ncbi:MAG: hypothetical protein H7Z13_18175 [Ferruginibacter sp.]|nr:hypothetical protein [Ferruginibacter sp.]
MIEKTTQEFINYKGDYQYKALPGDILPVLSYWDYGKGDKRYNRKDSSQDAGFTLYFSDKEYINNKK